MIFRSLVTRNEKSITQQPVLAKENETPK